MINDRNLKDNKCNNKWKSALKSIIFYDYNRGFKAQMTVKLK